MRAAAFPPSEKSALSSLQPPSSHLSQLLCSLTSWENTPLAWLLFYYYHINVTKSNTDKEIPHNEAAWEQKNQQTHSEKGGNVVQKWGYNHLWVLKFIFRTAEVERMCLSDFFPLQRKSHMANFLELVPVHLYQSPLGNVILHQVVF